MATTSSHGVEVSRRRPGRALAKAPLLADRILLALLACVSPPVGIEEDCGSRSGSQRILQEMMDPGRFLYGFLTPNDLSISVSCLRASSSVGTPSSLRRSSVTPGPNSKSLTGSSGPEE